MLRAFGCHPLTAVHDLNRTIEPRDKSCMEPRKGGVGKVPVPPSVGKYDPLTHEWLIEPKDRRYLERTSKHHMLTRAKPFES